MSSGSSPSEKFKYFVNFEKVGGTSDFVVRTVILGEYTVGDTADSPSDNTTQLGDIQNEAYKVTGANGTVFQPDLTYYGQMTKNPGVVGRVPNKNGAFSYILYTNSKYTNGAYIKASDISQTAFTLCFTSGTRILTTRGEVAVEQLRTSDVVLTASGRQRPITWIGHRQLGTATAPISFEQQPVRVRAGAFGPGLPARDMCLSAGHPVLVGAEADGEGGVLVPVMCLINGISIAREPVDAVTYWHIELDAHDILLAEGLPAESFLDFGCRDFFEEGSDHALHNPDFVPAGLSGRCRPVVTDGPLVEAERRRLDGVFAQALADQCDWVAPSCFDATAA